MTRTGTTAGCYVPSQREPKVIMGLTALLDAYSYTTRVIQESHTW